MTLLIVVTGYVINILILFTYFMFDKNNIAKGHTAPFWTLVKASIIPYGPIFLLSFLLSLLIMCSPFIITIMVLETFRLSIEKLDKHIVKLANKLDETS